MDIIKINGSKSHTKEEFYIYLKHKLDLPAYCGNNLDALADCVPETCHGKTLILTHPDALKANLGEYGERMIAVFSAVAAKSGAFTFEIEE